MNTSIFAMGNKLLPHHAQKDLPDIPESEEEIAKILQEMKEKQIVVSDHLPLVEKALRDKFYEVQARQTRNKYAAKIRSVEEKIFLWSAGSKVPVKAVVVGIEPTSFSETAGILYLNYRDVEQFGQRKLIGIARHEIGHVLYSRYKAIEEMLKIGNEQMRYFLERIYRYPEFHSFWNAREDVWVNYIMKNPYQWGNIQLWELLIYDYYYRFRIQYGVSAEEQEVRIDEDDAPVDSGIYEEKCVIYLESAAKTPQAVYTTELFLKAITGHYSPVFETLRQGSTPLQQKIYEYVRSAQKDFEDSTIDREVQPNFAICSIGASQKPVQETGAAESVPDGLWALHIGYMLDENRVEREVINASIRSIQKFITSEEIIPHFLDLMGSSQSKDAVQKKDEMLKAFNEVKAQMKAEQEIWIEQAKVEGKNVQEYLGEQIKQQREKAKAAELNAMEIVDSVVQDASIQNKIKSLNERCQRPLVESSQKRKENIDERLRQLQALVRDIQDELDRNEGKNNESNLSRDTSQLSPEELKKSLQEALDELLGGVPLTTQSADSGSTTPAIKLTSSQRGAEAHLDLKDILKENLGNLLGTLQGVAGRLNEPEAGELGAKEAAAVAANHAIRKALGLSNELENFMGSRHAHDPLNWHSQEESQDKTDTRQRGMESEPEASASTGNKSSASEESAQGNGKIQSGADQENTADGLSHQPTPSTETENGDGVLGEIIEDMLHSEQDKIEQKGSQNSGSSTNVKMPDTFRPSKLRVDLDKLEKKLDQYSKDAQLRQKRAEEVRKYVEPISQKAKIYANKIRAILMGQAEREIEIPGKIGNRLNFKRYLKRESRFWDKVVMDSNMESVDVDIVIDLSGSMRIVNVPLARLAVFMYEKFSDLVDVGINFRICGLDENGIVKIFQDYCTNSKKKVDREDLCKLYAEMESEIGNHGWQRFAVALRQSGETFQKRANAKHKVLFFMSDGLDEDGRVRTDENKKYHSSNPEVDHWIEFLEKKLKICVIGIGIGPESDPINMFDPWIKICDDYETIGEVVMKILEIVVSSGKIPKGDLRSSLVNKK